MPIHYEYARFYEDTKSSVIGFEEALKGDLLNLCIVGGIDTPIVTTFRKDLKVVFEYSDGSKEVHRFIGRRSNRDIWYRDHLGGIQLSGWCVVGGVWSAEEINYFNSRCRISLGREIK